MREVIVTEHGGPETLEFREADAPEPGDGEVLVDVEAIGVNWTDIDQREGNYRNSPDPPVRIGNEAAGVVLETGPDVEEWAAGDEVIGIFREGTYAEMAVARSHRLLPQPDGHDSVESAGAVAQGITAHNVVHEWGEIETGETVLIHAAAGGVGSTAVQIASAAGTTVLGTASTAEKLAFAAECGADHTINYEQQNVPDVVAEITDDGLDAVLDGVGGSAFYDSFDCLRTGGRIVSYGAASGRIPTVATPRLYHDNLTVIGYDLTTALDEQIDLVRAAKDHLYELLADGSVEIRTTDVRPLSEVVDVHREIEARETTGKVVLVPDG